MAIRNELTAVAVRLFTEHGFAETTARDIAQAVGVSERTFFSLLLVVGDDYDFAHVPL
jgi:AcrR family transcriptional regulator